MRNLSLLVIVFGLSGCFMGPWGTYEDSDDSWDTYNDYHEVDGQIEQAWLGGDMTDLGTFEGDAYEATYYGDDYSSRIVLHAGQDGGNDFGWAMIGLSTTAEGGFAGDTFAPGARLTLESGSLDAQGCTGPTHGDYDFDGHASQIEVEVEEGPTPNSRLFHFRAVYDQYNGGVTEGSFILIDEEPSQNTTTGIVDA